MGGFCHHAGSTSGQWCGGLSCTNPETGTQAGFPSCCDIVSAGCGGVATISSPTPPTNDNFGTGKPVGSDLEIAVMTGADGSKTAENAGELLISRVLIPFTLLGVAIYVGIKVLEKNLPELK